MTTWCKGALNKVACLRLNCLPLPGVNTIIIKITRHKLWSVIAPRGKQLASPDFGNSCLMHRGRVWRHARRSRRNREHVGAAQSCSVACLVINHLMATSLCTHCGGCRANRRAGGEHLGADRPSLVRGLVAEPLTMMGVVRRNGKVR